MCDIKPFYHPLVFRYKAISGAPPDPIFLLPDKVQPSYDIRQEKGFFDDIIEEGGGPQTVSAAFSTSAGC
jgi:hypothetical protein